MLAMFIGALCHDLDHRGFNNKFMIDIGSPLAAIYSTSTMENHHFNMTVNILQQEQNNIFSKLNPDEYRSVHCTSLVLNLLIFLTLLVFLIILYLLFLPHKMKLALVMMLNQSLKEFWSFKDFPIND